MNTRRPVWLWLEMCACLLWAVSAHAFYNPQVGGWLNRDPIEEPAARLAMRPPPTPHHIGESGLYTFVAGDPVRRADWLGLKFEPPPTWCKDPCAWARQHEKNANVYGIVVCCNGKKYGCVLRIKGQSHVTHPQPLRVVENCIQGHENYHVSDPLIVCRTKCGYDWTTGDAWEQLHSDCEAYSGDVLCLAGRRRYCFGDPVCEGQIDAEIKTVDARARKVCAQLPGQGEGGSSRSGGLEFGPP